MQSQFQPHPSLLDPPHGYHLYPPSRYLSDFNTSSKMNNTTPEYPFSSFSGVHPAATGSAISPASQPSQYPELSLDQIPPPQPPLPPRIFAILFLETFQDSTTPPLFSLISLHRSLPTANAAAMAFWREWPAHEFLGGIWEGGMEQERFGRFTACGSVGGRWCAVRVVERGVVD
jgi:hypothetical protein